MEEQKALNLTSDGSWTGPGRNATRFAALQSLTRRRRLHNLQNITSADAAIMRANSERVMRTFLDGQVSKCTWLDWSFLANNLVQDFASAFFNLLRTLEKFEDMISSNQSSVRAWMIDVRDQTHSFLVPFLQYPENISAQTWTRDSSIFKETYSRCRFEHTRLLDADLGMDLGHEEAPLKWAVEETMGGICSVIVEVGLAVEGRWMSELNTPLNSSTALLTADMRQDIQHWTYGIEELMAWLGWAGEWISCDKKCNWDESFFIPMWPLIHWGGGRRRRPYGEPPPYRYGYPGSPGSGIPSHGELPPSYEYPGNATRHQGLPSWGMGEEVLWTPKCVKSDYLRGS
ncbi:hypothetical protein LZ554_004049 [Drepanopeziza brunnea f. sp. 'monogermtubi']|nr:hypothetical protein LZ554_004049 [Drepanopeziza brunnea f. sp. 'monogermtubi']